MAASMRQLTRKLADGTRRLWRYTPYYLCHRTTGGKACVGIMGDRFEEYVRDWLFGELDKPTFRDALAVNQHEARRYEIIVALNATDSRRAELAEMFGSGELTTAEWRVAKQAIVDEELRLRGELATVPQAATGVAPENLRRDWDFITLDERRHEISKYIEQVEVMPAVPGTRTFDINRVKIKKRELNGAGD
jgi:crotonobetainyl-CoA:carnitine CoA-transferase CaiB-like acyl-CoA transferase